ncbi:aldose epimerase family protein [Halomonas sp. LS-001]
MTKAYQKISDRIAVSHFGSLEDGQAVEVYELKNRNGVTVKISPYGGLIVSICTPDKYGEFGDITLGFNSLSDYCSERYRQENPYFGALIGRYANRIKQGRFSLNGQAYTLSCNEGTNHLHGGQQGFDQRLWSAKTVETASGAGVELTLTSPDGDQGYPGELIACIRYLLDDDNRLTLDYHATCDAATHVNLTQHSYFNLEGEGQRDILDHQLMIAADYITPVDDALIPTGTLTSVANTPFDFRTAKAIGRDIKAPDAQLQLGQGFDHNFVIRQPEHHTDKLVMAARLIAPASGRVLEIRTTEPGLQFYSGNFLNGALVGKAGKAYQHRYGLALETQHFPDSPNQPAFPNTRLEPDQVYRSQTQYLFSTLS